eukprot:TRINITY_DN3415_c0_g2_i1.p6 TRINITY_DN3415_c0_g2~~TRINITY_DN3415_c0_g2_i1.p6  ORF type:complete len:137 (-),score=18.68 TRINITY_DN3415_c0_g2_i1:2844-3254(-)
MASSVRTGLEKVYGQLISFSLINVTLPQAIEQALIDQQVNKRKVETATERQKIQEIEGQIEKIKNEGSVNEANILAEAKSYYDRTIKSALSNINYQKYLTELKAVNNDTTGVFKKYFSVGSKNAAFNKFCWYKKVI